MSRIVIIGGMGPQASLELHQRIIARAATRGGRDGDEYPEILHLSIPVPDFISSGKTEPGLTRIFQSLDQVNLQTEDKLILACNTAHLLVDEIECKYQIKFISLIDAVTNSISKAGLKRVGLLGTPTTLRSKLYSLPLDNAGVDLIVPTRKELECLEKVIRSVIANQSPSNTASLVNPIISRMLADGAEKVVVGCTELSVILSGNKNQVIIDPLEIVCNQLFKKEISNE